MEVGSLGNDLEKGLPKKVRKQVVNGEYPLAQNKQTNKQEEQMLNRSIFPILTELLHSHLPYIINHHEHLSYFMQLYNTMTA